jgi:hypothetical protein
MKTFNVKVRIGNGPDSILVKHTEYSLTDEQIERIIAESKKMFESPGEHIWFCVHLSMGIWDLYSGHAPRHDDEDVLNNPHAVVAAVIVQTHHAYWEAVIKAPGTATFLDGFCPRDIKFDTANLNIVCTCTHT